MSLQLVRLKLRAETPAGSFGAEIPFESGLNLIRAGNTSGKSTCLQAILFALGLEQMLGSTRVVPLPPSMTKVLAEGEGEAEKEYVVLESHVFLEIRNRAGEHLTLQRTAKGERDERLVSVWEGPALSKPGKSYSQSDYFLRDAGSATRERGLHTRLVAFIGWDLPRVPNFKGSETLLYPQCVFPLFVVEQKLGWSGIQATTPTFLGIREVDRRAFEFVAGLDAGKIANARLRIAEAERTLRSEWTAALGECERTVRGLGGTTQGIPASPVTAFPSEVSPTVLRPRADEWVPLADALREDRIELHLYCARYLGHGFD